LDSIEKIQHSDGKLEFKRRVRFSSSRMIAAAMVGGTTSIITGGKFGNGAVTGDFSQAFNDEFHGEMIMSLEEAVENGKLVKDVNLIRADVIDLFHCGACDFSRQRACADGRRQSQYKLDRTHKVNFLLTGHQDQHIYAVLKA
jgi:hypothetical protein